MTDIELKKLDILDREARVKELELEHKIAEAKKSAWRSPIVVAIFAAAAGAFGNAVVTYYSSSLDRDAASDEYERTVSLAEIAAERTRILEMIKIGDPEQVQRNLQFLIDTELVQDSETVANILAYYEDRDASTGPGATQPGGTGRIDRSRVFQNSATLTYAFLEQPSDGLVAAVETATSEWMKYANVTFERTDDLSSAIIRIQPSDFQNWSYVGRDALAVASSEPTMSLADRENFDEFGLAAVISQFGHALGLVNEHQNPRHQIPWDVDATYEYFMHTQGFTRNWVDHNLLSRSNSYPCPREFDPNSIMMYRIPAELTQDQTEYGGATEISPSDQQCIAFMYPSPIVTED